MNKNNLEYEWFLKLIPRRLQKKWKFSGKYKLSEKDTLENIKVTEQKLLIIPTTGKPKTKTPTTTIKGDFIELDILMIPKWCRFRTESSFCKEYRVEKIPIQHDEILYFLNEILINYELNKLDYAVPTNLPEPFDLVETRAILSENFSEMKKVTKNIKESSFLIISKRYGESIFRFLQNKDIISSNKFSKMIKCIYLNCIYAMYCAKRKLGDFLHLDLHSGNMVIEKINKDKYKWIIFMFDFDNYFIIKTEECDFIVKIIDFDQSKITKPVVKIKEDEKKKLNVKKDINIVFNELDKRGYFYKGKKKRGKEEADFKVFNDRLKERKALNPALKIIEKIKSFKKFRTTLNKAKTSQNLFYIISNSKLENSFLYEFSKNRKDQPSKEDYNSKNVLIYSAMYL